MEDAEQSLTAVVHLTAVLASFLEIETLIPIRIAVLLKEGEVDAKVIPQAGLAAILLYRIAELTHDVGCIGRTAPLAVHPQACAIFLEGPGVAAGIAGGLVGNHVNLVRAP